MLRRKVQGKGFEQGGFYCPGKETAMVIIVVSLPCTAYLCGALIVLQKSFELRALSHGLWTPKYKLQVVRQNTPVLIFFDQR